MSDRMCARCGQRPVDAGFLALQVVLAKDGDGWVAQGIELDYAACGSSTDNVRDRFERGLRATIHAHLDRFGDLDRLFTPTPSETWMRLIAAEHQKRGSHVSPHRFFSPAPLPFGKIVYLIPSR